MSCLRDKLLAWLMILFSCSMIAPAWGEETPRNFKVSSHNTKAGHAFHYMKMLDAKEVVIILTWPHDWIDQGGAVAVPYVGENLMLSAGAGERDAATLTADFEDLNAVGNLDATADHMVGVLRVAPRNLAAAVDLARDVLVSPRLDDRWRKRLQQSLKARLLEQHQQLINETWIAAARFLLGNGPLNDFSSLYPANLYDDVSLAGIERWHATTFSIDGVKIAAAGPIDPTVVADAIDRLLDGMPKNAPRDTPREKPAVPGSSGKTILLHKPDAEKAVIAVIGPIPPTREPGQFLDLFASHSLGAGKQSRLFEAIRTKLRASYGPRAGLYNYSQDVRTIYFDSEADDQRVGDVYAAFRDTYETLRINGITVEEFERIKEALVANLNEAQKNPGIMASVLMGFLLDDDPLIHRAGELPEMIEAITLDEVNAALQDRLPAFDTMVRVVATSNADAVNADCVVKSIADVDRCHD